MNTAQSRLGTLQYGILLLTAATGVIHLFLATLDLPAQARVMFALNGIGYFVLVVGLYFLPQLAGRRGLVRLALMAYTAVTIIGWLVLNGDFTDPLGVITKLIEIILIILLVMEHRAQTA